MPCANSRYKRACAKLISTKMSAKQVPDVYAALNCEEELHNDVPPLLALAFKAVYNGHNSRHLPDLERIAAVSHRLENLWFYVDPPLYSPKLFYSMMCAADLLKNTRLLHEHLNWNRPMWISTRRAKRKCYHLNKEACKPFFNITGHGDSLDPKCKRCSSK